MRLNRATANFLCAISIAFFTNIAPRSVSAAPFWRSIFSNRSTWSETQTCSALLESLTQIKNKLDFYRSSTGERDSEVANRRDLAIQRLRSFSKSLRDTAGTAAQDALPLADQIVDSSSPVFNLALAERIDRLVELEIKGLNFEGQLAGTSVIHLSAEEMNALFRRVRESLRETEETTAPAHSIAQEKFRWRIFPALLLAAGGLAQAVHGVAVANPIILRSSGILIILSALYFTQVYNWQSAFSHSVAGESLRGLLDRLISMRIEELKPGEWVHWRSPIFSLHPRIAKEMSDGSLNSETVSMIDRKMSLSRFSRFLSFMHGDADERELKRSSRSLQERFYFFLIPDESGAPTLVIVNQTFRINRFPGKKDDGPDNTRREDNWGGGLRELKPALVPIRP